MSLATVANIMGVRFSILLATVALFATATRGATVKFNNKLGTDSIMQEGTSFEVKWIWDGDANANAVGDLVLTTFMRDDAGRDMNSTIEDNLDLSKESYTWTVKTSKGRRSLDWYYRMNINYDEGASWSSGRGFRIMATTTTSSTTSSPTGTKSPDKPKDSSNNAPGISGGAIAGIVVGSVVGVGLIVALVGLILYYRRRSRRGMVPFTPLGDVGVGVGAGAGSWAGNGFGNGEGTPSSSAPDYKKNGAGFGGVPASKYEPERPEELDTVNPPTMFELEGTTAGTGRA